VSITDIDRKLSKLREEYVWIPHIMKIANHYLEELKRVPTSRLTDEGSKLLSDEISRVTLFIGRLSTKLGSIPKEQKEALAQRREVLRNIALRGGLKLVSGNQRNQRKT